MTVIEITQNFFLFVSSFLMRWLLGMKDAALSLSLVWITLLVRSSFRKIKHRVTNIRSFETGRTKRMNPFSWLNYLSIIFQESKPVLYQFIRQILPWVSSKFFKLKILPDQKIISPFVSKEFPSQLKELNILSPKVSTFV